MTSRWSWALGAPLLVFVLFPFVALLAASSASELGAALDHPTLAQAAWLSLRTSLVSLGVVILAGTPLSWWLARSQGWVSRVVETLVALPIVIPPAVVGVALLEAYGRQSAAGGVLAGLGVSVAFTSTAVVFAQILVAAPFYIQSATAGFRKVDPDMILVARTLGATPLRAFMGVVVPSAAPALLAGAALCWARAVGEFGATLLFAGSLPGRTQTMPLAIFTALEADVGLARSLSVLLGVVALVVLLAVRSVPALRAGRV
jgi:molybdate transport system permease protein